MLSLAAEHGRGGVSAPLRPVGTLRSVATGQWAVPSDAGPWGGRGPSRRPAGKLIRARQRQRFNRFIKTTHPLVP